MIQAKLYGIMKKYMGEFLFGFDKNQLEVAIFSGTPTSNIREIKLERCEYKARSNKCEVIDS
jgi:hypothetical protein